MDAALWAEIRRLHLREGWPRRRIARHLGVARKTVDRALGQPRHEPARQAAPRPSMLDPFREHLRARLAEEPTISLVRLQADLEERGYAGSHTILGDFVRALRPRVRPEAFLRLSFPPGDVAQVDWTACGSLLVDGRARRLSAFLFVLGHSRWLHAEFTLCEQLEVVLACHERAFLGAQGVPRRVMYDNLRSVVLAHVGADVRLNPRFLDFSAHYGFKPVACAPYRPNEKGRVENVAKYLKGNFLAARVFESLQAANQALRLWLDTVANVREHRATRRRPVDLLAEERPLLAPLPASPYDTRVVRTVKATPLCRVHFDANTYSVPPAHAGAVLTLKATATHVCVYAGAEEIASHPRSSGRGVDTVDPGHVRALLDTKRRGDRGALVHRFTALGAAAEAYLPGLVKSEIALYRHLKRILALADRFGRHEVLLALAHAQQFGAFGADYVERILVEHRRRDRRLQPPAELSLPRAPDLERITLEEIDLSLYDLALGTTTTDEQAPPAPEPGGATPGEPPPPGSHPHGGNLPGEDPEGDPGGCLVPRVP